MFGDWIDRRCADSCIILEPYIEPKVGRGLDKNGRDKMLPLSRAFPEIHSVVDYWVHPFFAPVGGHATPVYVFHISKSSTKKNRVCAALASCLLLLSAWFKLLSTSSQVHVLLPFPFASTGQRLSFIHV